MKKVFLVLLGAAALGTAKAQVQYGVKAGANFANVIGSDADDAKMKVGFNAGAFARFSINESFKVQPELVYSGQGAKYDDESLDLKLNLDYLNIPVLFQYHTNSGFFAETGPQLGFLLSAKLKADGESEDVKDSFKSTDFSWAFGAGYQFAQGFGVNARYNLGLSKIEESGEANVKNGVFQVGLFYTFGGK
ncbi:PorT family protein [Flavihumibacter rivuli]|uniref:porin family protein n=1 Tax=Flavihumibacter rivuli TaxID=2838156 RepID=UPI001BDF2841|nr:porin family protein [Flavihumibacter rivuli]ULQ57914.1 PorT family protein [Flavihumibacter rivuli]